MFVYFFYCLFFAIYMYKYIYKILMYKARKPREA